MSVLGYSMDSTDLKIISELDRNGRESFERIAKKLGTARRTVNRRVGLMVSSGFIKSFEVLMESSILGLGQATCNVKVKSTTNVNTTREKLLKIPGVVEILTFIGGALVAYIYYRDQAQLEDILIHI